MSDVYYNVESKKLYKLVERDNTQNTLKRLGDNRTYYLCHNTFQMKYRALNPELLEIAQNYSGEDVVTVDELLSPSKGFTSQVGVFVPYSDCLGLDKTIMSEEVYKSIKLGLHKIQNQELLMNEWKMGEIPGFSFGTSLNLFGPPGTGKTMAAKAIANELKMNLIQVDYSQVISKWVGGTGKNISQIFKETKEQNAIVLFDEADSLLSKRRNLDSDGQSNSVNQNRNILMQEIDRFEGICLFATNFFGNYDEAINRRIAQHIEFKLPDEEALLKILKLHIPKAVPSKRISFKNIAKVCLGLSGGDIKNICINSIIEASMSKEKKLTETILMSHIEDIKKSKDVHKGKNKRAKIGLAGEALKRLK